MAAIQVFSNVGETSLPASTTSYFALGNLPSASRLTESNTHITYRVAGTFSNLYCRVSVNDRGASTFRLRVNSANVNSILSIGASATGEFEDASNTDSISSADEVDCLLTTGSGGTVFNISIISCLFNATSNSVIKWAGESGGTITTASTTFYHCIVGILSGGTTTETDVQFESTIPGTWKNLGVNVRTNTRTTTTTLRGRKNGANGNQFIDVLTLQTGIYEDTTNSDSLIAGDLLTYSVTMGTDSNSFRMYNFWSDFETTNNKTLQFNGNTDLELIGSANTADYSFGQLYQASSESVAQTRILKACRTSNLQTHVISNNLNATATLRVRKNATNGNGVISITTSTTGFFEDTTNIDSFSKKGDEIHFQFVTGGTSGGIVYQGMGLVFDYNQLFMLMGVGV